MDICLCGAESGYRHEPTCPYPLYRATAAQEDAWLRARADKRARSRAERAKVPDDRGFAKAGEFRRVWQNLEAWGAVDGWGGAECRRVWREYLDAGMPDDVAAFVQRRANVLSEDGCRARGARPGRPPGGAEGSGWHASGAERGGAGRTGGSPRGRSR